MCDTHKIPFPKQSFSKVNRNSRKALSQPYPGDYYIFGKNSTGLLHLFSELIHLWKNIFASLKKKKNTKTSSAYINNFLLMFPCQQESLHTPTDQRGLQSGGCATTVSNCTGTCPPVCIQCACVYIPLPNRGSAKGLQLHAHMLLQVCSHESRAG